jgi:hypothetical protein
LYLSRDPQICPLSSHTLRRWLISEGIWTPRLRGRRHRKRRDRRAAFGELVLMDSSEHDWLEGRSCWALVRRHDRRCHEPLVCRFFPTDSGAANRQIIIECLRRYGRMGATCADAAGLLRGNFRATARRERDLPEAKTLICKALEGLDTELIIALTPQAKGRVERLFGTLQDRLIEEKRVAGTSSMEEAKRSCWSSWSTTPPAACSATFFPTDSGAAIGIIIEYLRRSGRMGATYAAGVGHFKVYFRTTAVHRSLIHYHFRRVPDTELRERLRSMASDRPRWGSPRLTRLLRREGVRINHKQVERLHW